MGKNAARANSYLHETLVPAASTQPCSSWQKIHTLKVTDEQEFPRVASNQTPVIIFPCAP